MLFRFEKFFHNQIQEIIETSNTKSYRIKHYFDSVSLSICCIRFSTCLYWLHMNVNFDNWYFDPFCNFILTIGGELNRLYILLAVMLILLGILGKFSFFLTNDITPFQIVYSLVVENDNQIKSCTQSKSKINEIFQKNLNEHLTKHLEKSFLKNFVPYFFLEKYCKILAKYELMMDLNYVDQNKISKLNSVHLPIYPLTWNLRKKLFHICSLMEKIFNIVHFLLGKFGQFKDQF